MTRRLRRSILASAVFILAGIGGAVGGHVTSKFTPAALAFVVLLILGGISALMLDRLTGDGGAVKTPDARAGPFVDARGSQAVQSGDHNVQINRHEPSEAPRQAEP